MTTQPSEEQVEKVTLYGTPTQNLAKKIELVLHMVYRKGRNFEEPFTGYEETHQILKFINDYEEKAYKGKTRNDKY